MRFVFIGSGSLAVLTGRLLAERGHEVVLVERDRSVIDALQEGLDLGFIHGDGTRPARFWIDFGPPRALPRPSP